MNGLDAVRSQSQFFCPACGGRLRLRKGSVKAAHFAHVNLDHCDSWSENESSQHLNLKIALYKWFEKSGAKVQMEHYLPELKQTPDLLVNHSLAIEVQCSHLSFERLKERTKAYQSGGYQVLWLLGRDLWLKNTLTFLQKGFLYLSQNRGFHFWELDLTRREIRIKFMIHENIRGKLTYLTEAFTFDQGKLLDVLRRPYQSQKEHLLFVKFDSGEELHYFIRQQLYRKNPKWLKVQEKFYRRGENILTKSYSSWLQWYPVGFSAFSDTQEEWLIQTPGRQCASYYQNYIAFHSKQKFSPLHSPAYYTAMLK